MIKVQEIVANKDTMKAVVSLFSDTKAEVASTALDDIVGFPKGYDIDFGSSVFTAAGEMAFRKSDNSWNWL